jgi:alcohol dehydrogenase (cytochrome c)
MGIAMSGPPNVPDDPKVFAANAKELQGWIIAWDPKTQSEAFRVDHKGPWNGGILATGGDLLFQGLADGSFHAYDATNGKDLFNFPAQTGIIAAPISYSVDGKQYVAVEAGWGGIWPLLGGALARTSGWTVNHSRVLVFALDGDASLPPENDKGFLPVKPPEHYDAARATAGYPKFQQFCMACHGDNAQSGGVIPDLRWSGAIRDADGFYNVVGRGALTAYGMISFSSVLTQDDIEDIRNFIIKRSNDTYQREVDARKTATGTPDSTHGGF